MRIGLSYHGGDEDYENYPAALRRRAAALGIEIDTFWFAGSGRDPHLEMLDSIDAVVMTGGPDVEPQRYGFADPSGLCKTNAERDALEWEILERLRRRPLPTLAICRGAQILNVFYGGTLVPDLAERNAVHRRDGDQRREHTVRIAEDSRLHALIGSKSGRVNSSHHQAVERLPPGFRAAAISEDGVLEAFERADAGGHPLLLGCSGTPRA